MAKISLKFADIVAAAVFAALSAALLFIGGPQAVTGASKETAEVLSVDNSPMQRLGMLYQGSQSLSVKITSGEKRGQIFRAENNLRAQMDLDKVFKPGDTIIVAIPKGADAKTSVLNAQDFYRGASAAILVGLFALLLAAFAGWTGIKALLSFVFSALFIWKIVVPMCLSGANAVLVCFVSVAILTFAIIFLVAGPTKKALAAFSGAMLGVGASCLMAIVFSEIFHINGAVMPFSQALLYSGREFLNLSDLFVGGIFLSSSGAVMDLAMDVAAGQDEVRAHSPQISRRALVLSGWRIGRSVVGTMTTTLLLAYSGGYLTLMMAFSAEGVSAIDFISNPYVAAELVKTIIGSFGLVLVAPFTAIVGGFVFAGKGK